MLEEFRASQCCCCCSALCQIGMPVNCLFLWLSSVTAVTGAISRGETNFFSKIHLNVNIFLNLVLFSSDPLAQNYAYLIGSVHNQMTFLSPLVGIPSKRTERT